MTNAIDQIASRLERLHPRLIDLSLDRLHTLLARLGNPHHRLPPVIHVAGTNGKGSTTAFMRAMLMETDYLGYLPRTQDFRLIKDFQQLLIKEPRLWVVDFSSVEYVDSSALGMLLLLRERVHGDMQRVQLRGLQGQPLEVLHMAKFDHMFKLD